MAKHHPDKEVSNVIEYALGLGWTAMKGTGHTYCTLYCPKNDRSGCKVRVFSTPQNSGNHARRLLHQIKNCPHM